MNFFQIIKKGTNKHLAALKNTAIYEIAKENLEVKPYSVTAKPLYLVSRYFSILYHFISYSVALIGITLFALQLDSMIQKVILISLSFLLLGIIETAKSNSSNTVFVSVARKESPNKLFLIVLLVTTVFSFITSVWSAKESIYYASTNSKFLSIDSLQNKQIDSINTLFAFQISSLQTSIEASQNTLKTSRNKWLKLATTKDLQNSQNNLSSVLERKEKALLSIQDDKTNLYRATSQNGKEIAIFAAVLFALFEALNLVCYWFVYQYYQSCLLENNLPNESNDPDPLSVAVKEFIQSISLRSNLNDTTDSVTNNVIQNPFTPTLPPTPAKKAIGFEFGNNNHNDNRNDPRNETKIDISKGNRICQNCNKAYTYKVHNQKFCSETCRINNWNQKTGKKFIKGKGGANA